MSNRHFGKLTQTNEEVVILGYQASFNELLIAVLAAMPYAEAAALRTIVSSATAQGKDYLMDVVSGSVLQGAHHPNGEDWQSYLIKQAVGGRNGMVRKVPMSEVEFADQTQKAFFAGYGPSIEPEVDKKRAIRKQTVDSTINGVPLPLDAEPAAPTPAPVTESVNGQLVDTLKTLAETQVEILKQLQGLNKPARKTTRRKTSTKRKPKAKVEPKADDGPQVLMEQNPAED